MDKLFQKNSLLSQDMYSEYSDDMENIKKVTQSILAENKCLLKEIGTITNKPQALTPRLDLKDSLKGCRRSKIFVTDSEKEFVIVKVQKATEVQDHKNPISFFETTILDREEINKIIVESIAKSEDWQELCENITKDALACAVDHGFTLNSMYTCAVFEAKDYAFESNFPSVGDYLEFEILDGRFILIYYGTALMTNKSYIVQA